ncbi:SRPBCC family protein [Alicyclobacillus sp. ALC3]|uniref:SRPBCC family protein n=1 Tax=Alicyclobacillus sp. ALC3 TaxID=2796143 RepID=UPI002378D628|nr:SRPBCC domain-containing protein [Alicyclobacillus sp. ALC3]
MSHSLPDIRHSVCLYVPVAQVWDAVATSEGIAGWFMPNSFEPTIGANFLLHSGQFGDSPCTVTKLVPKKVVEFRWDDDWTLRFELLGVGEHNTEFTLVHSGWDAEKRTRFGQPHTVIRGIMDGGWEKKVKQDLPNYVESR